MEDEFHVEIEEEELPEIDPNPDVPEPQVDPATAGIYQVQITGVVAAENFLEAQMYVFRSLVACNELPVRFYSSDVKLVQTDAE